jgi:UDPglucose 6-dehydrogenase
MSQINHDYDPSLLNVIDDPFLNLKSHNIIAILTEWDEFKEYDWNKIYQKQKKPSHIFDGRNILNVTQVRNIGFNYMGLGR